MGAITDESLSLACPHPQVLGVGFVRSGNGSEPDTHEPSSPLVSTSGCVIPGKSILSAGSELSQTGILFPLPQSTLFSILHVIHPMVL